MEHYRRKCKDIPEFVLRNGVTVDMSRNELQAQTQEIIEIFLKKNAIRLPKKVQDKLIIELETLGDYHPEVFDESCKFVMDRLKTTSIPAFYTQGLEIEQGCRWGKKGHNVTSQLPELHHSNKNNQFVEILGVVTEVEVEVEVGAAVDEFARRGKTESLCQERVLGDWGYRNGGIPGKEQARLDERLLVDGQRDAMHSTLSRAEGNLAVMREAEGGKAGRGGLVKRLSDDAARRLTTHRVGDNGHVIAGSRDKGSAGDNEFGEAVVGGHDGEGASICAGGGRGEQHGGGRRGGRVCEHGEAQEGRARTARGGVQRPEPRALPPRKPRRPPHGGLRRLCQRGQGQRALRHARRRRRNAAGARNQRPRRRPRRRRRRRGARGKVRRHQPQPVAVRPLEHRRPPDVDVDVDADVRANTGCGCVAAAVVVVVAVAVAVAAVVANKDMTGMDFIDPEEPFARSLKYMQSMGLSNVPMNRLALERSGGQVQQAIDWVTTDSIPDSGVDTDSLGAYVRRKEQTVTPHQANIKQLRSMGFTDDALNLKALREANNDLDAAVQWLIQKTADPEVKALFSSSSASSPSKSVTFHQPHPPLASPTYRQSTLPNSAQNSIPAYQYATTTTTNPTANSSYDPIAAAFTLQPLSSSFTPSRLLPSQMQPQSLAFNNNYPTDNYSSYNNSSSIPAASTTTAQIPINPFGGGSLAFQSNQSYPLSSNVGVSSPPLSYNIIAPKRIDENKFLSEADLRRMGMLPSGNELSNSGASAAVNASAGASASGGWAAVANTGLNGGGNRYQQGGWSLEQHHHNNNQQEQQQDTKQAVAVAAGAEEEEDDPFADPFAD
ncbi:hypothetical protein HK100_011678 [Physocladia obscura]|uniref:UBA domain-containing protein n=1 Tax=Physocladia obscura TaxID=109957 RepID=A0AAD5T3Q9_9FUNG|nr:hypothetical protein HK100_011678 [Physocladia obscura]